MLDADGQLIQGLFDDTSKRNDEIVLDPSSVVRS